MRSIELFSGTGGLALGLHRAGFVHTSLYEMDKDACENLRRNAMPDTPGGSVRWQVCRADVRDIDFRPYEGSVQLVAGGPPCQPFSLGGKGAAYNDRRDMFPEAVRAIREIKPQAFIIENVKGLLRKTFATYFNYILLQLTYPGITRKAGMGWEEHLALLEKHHTSKSRSALRYNVTFRLVNAADYGVPQNRQRVIIVGFRSDMDVRWTFPATTHSKQSLDYAKWATGSYWTEHGMERPKGMGPSAVQLDFLREHGDTQLSKERWRTVRDALAGLPDPSLIEAAGNIPNHLFKGYSRSYPGHTGSVMDEPSKTIKAGAHGVPGGENMVVLDDGTTRYYTVRESARMQTFPDDFTFGASWTESMRQIGNAVPVRLAEIVGQSVIAQL